MHQGPTDHPQVCSKQAPIRVLGTHLGTVQFHKLRFQKWACSTQQHPQRLCRGGRHDAHPGGESLRPHTGTRGLTEQTAAARQAKLTDSEDKHKESQIGKQGNKHGNNDQTMQ